MASDAAALGFDSRVVKVGEIITFYKQSLSVPVSARSTAARLLRLWVRIPPGYGCLSVGNVVCCQVEVSATG